MRLLVGSLLIAASIVPTIVHSSGTTFREIFDFSWQYALSPARAEKADRMAMADPTLDREREIERERMRVAILQAEVTLLGLPLPDVIATLPKELTSPPDMPVELVCDALARAAEETGLPPAFFARLIWQESKFKQRVVSHAGARGVAQFMPETAVQFGLQSVRPDRLGRSVGALPARIVPAIRQYRPRCRGLQRRSTPDHGLARPARQDAGRDP